MSESQDGASYIYLICDGRYRKIGKSDDPAARVAKIRSNNITVALIKTWETSRWYEAEQAIHKSLSNTRIEGEWFSDSIESCILVIEACIASLKEAPTTEVAQDALQECNNGPAYGWWLGVVRVDQDRPS